MNALDALAAQYVASDSVSTLAAAKELAEFAVMFLLVSPNYDANVHGETEDDRAEYILGRLAKRKDRMRA